MGVVDFDPENWSRSNGSGDGPDAAKVARLAKVDGDEAEHSRLSQLSQVAALPADVLAGLAALQLLPSSRKINAGHWKSAVADCLRLASEGWAAKALALGWSPLELFGAATAIDGDPEGDGLAVWLRGRPILAICETYVAVEDLGGRSYYNRRQADGAMLVWDIGRERW